MNHSNQPVAIVTGAGSGIGRAVAIGLGAKGYRLVLVGRRLEPLLETGQLLAHQVAHQVGHRGDDWVAFDADIASCHDRKKTISQTLDRFGRIDSVINNAGLGTCKVLGDLGEAEILDLFAVNAIGPIELVRLALPELIKSKGCIVNIASMAIVDPFVGLGVYGCAKAAVDGLTRAIHNEYSEQGVRAYTVAPGAVETEMLRSIVSEEILPTDQTLSPEAVAGKIIECVTGEVAEVSGSTIFINK